VTDPVRGKTLRFSFSDGPTAGKTYEHRFHEDGTVTWRDMAASPKPGASNEAGNRPKYAAMKVAQNAYAVSYLSASGYTLTVVLNFDDHRLVGFASSDKQWFPVKGSFEEA
jgi:hypothetical protein